MNPTPPSSLASRPPLAVSILMPSFNHASFLEEAINSIGLADQPDVELVVADGGSTDGTLGILARTAQRYPGQLRFDSAPDGGPAQAVNRALGLARGALIGWLNADDRYAPGAVARARAHLERHPEQVMVYGHGEHIDAAGRPLARYPTVPPQAWLERAADGCGLCQPTAFLRREVLRAHGGLDATLRAAFDFDLWLRLWRAYPSRIGFLDAVQAQSRLHAGGITLRERRTVALEALRVLRLHLGSAPAHWLHTWIDERIASHPWAADSLPLADALHDTLAAAAADIGERATAEVARHIDAHPAVRTSDPLVAIDLSADGWVLPRAQLRWRQPAAGEPPLTRVTLEAEHAHPAGRPMRLRVTSPDGSMQELSVSANGPFTLVLEIPDQRPQARGIHQLECLDPFTPRDVEAGSTDSRSLAFRVHRVRPRRG